MEWIILIVIIAIIVFKSIPENDVSGTYKSIVVTADKAECQHRIVSRPFMGGNARCVGCGVEIPDDVALKKEDLCHRHEWEYYTSPHDLYRGRPATKRRCKRCGKRDFDYLS